MLRLRSFKDMLDQPIHQIPPGKRRHMYRPYFDRSIIRNSNRSSSSRLSCDFG
jgi:hypothetical protein